MEAFYTKAVLSVQPSSFRRYICASLMSQNPLTVHDVFISFPPCFSLKRGVTYKKLISQNTHGPYISLGVVSDVVDIFILVRETLVGALEYLRSLLSYSFMTRRVL